MTIKFYSGNLVDQATLTASTENLQFPLSNIKDPRRTKVFRSQTNADNFVMDFLETSEIDSVILVDNHKSGFGVATLTLELNGTNTWTAPAFSQALSIQSSKFGVGFDEFETVQSYRFGRLVMTSTLGYCEISKIFIGKQIELLDEKSINYGWTYVDDDLSTVEENRYGQEFVDLVARRKKIVVSFSNMTKEQMDQIFEIYDEKGVTKPFYVRLGCANMTTDFRRFSGMVKMASMPLITNKSFGRYSFSMTLKECM